MGRLFLELASAAFQNIIFEYIKEKKKEEEAVKIVLMQRGLFSVLGGFFRVANRCRNELSLTMKTVWKTKLTVEND